MRLRINIFWLVLVVRKVVGIKYLIGESEFMLFRVVSGYGKSYWKCLEGVSSGFFMLYGCE